MTNLLPILAAYIAPSVVQSALDNPSPTPLKEPQAARFPAAVLFADISGFTALAESLAQKGPEGAEELTRLLNGYFGRMLSLIEAEGGEVVKFSGDAVTVVFPARHEPLAIATRRAYQAAEAMQAAMKEFATLKTSIGSIALGMKIGIGAGEVLALQVGGIFNRWEYVIAGDPIQQVAQAEHQARRGEIILSPTAAAIIAPHPVTALPLPQPDWTAVQEREAVEAALRSFVPGAIQVWLRQELQAWLAELRPMSVLFVAVYGLHYEQDSTVEELHAFLRGAQQVIYRYEGSINKLAVDDKGTILIVLFGAPPFAHENDPERALRCAIDLQAMAQNHALQLSTGVTTGRVFAGPVGSQTRREYTVIGDTVNLAARLMSTAGVGQVRCDYDTYHRTRHKLTFDILAPVRLKGKAGFIRVYRPTGEVGQQKEAQPSSVLVGRETEMARLTAALDDIQTGYSRNHCLLIEGEAGIGKSRLLAEMVRVMRERGIVGLLGMGRSIEQQTPYRAWRDIFTSYFDLDSVDEPAIRRQRVEERVHDVTPHLIERLPLLDDVLNLGIAENELTASLDTQLRHESLVSLLLALLQAWTAERPLVLVLEDAHWLDSLSWDLTLQVVRAFSVARTPLLLVILMRPLEAETTRTELVTLASLEMTERIHLATLPPEETVALAAARLGLARDDIPQPLAQLVQTRAGGNPFFAEELVYALRDNGVITVQTGEDGKTRCLVIDDLAQVAHTLPATIQGVILSRIDRLKPEEQLTLKVAAVIGRTFVYTTLRDTLGEHMELSGRLLKSYLDELAQLDLTPLEAPEPELTYIFKHIITQEVAYETLLFAQRRQLHRTVALWYERRYGNGQEGSGEAELESPLAPYYPLLVYHWHQAGDEARERQYARLAGLWASAQFANVEAAVYLSRALDLTPEDELEARYELLLAREAVNDLRGEREAQAQDLATLASLAAAWQDERREAEVALRQANYFEAVSDYPAALATAQHAVARAAAAGDPLKETEGYIKWGAALWHQGEYEAARTPLEQALLKARSGQDRYGEARSLYHLSILSIYQGNYPAAQEHCLQALHIYRSGGHRLGEADSLSILGVIHSELGDYLAARDNYERALSILQTIGDRRGETIALGNLGNVYCDLGDYEAARDYHQRALDVRLTIGDRWGEATSLVNLGLVYHGLRDYETAQKQCQRALEIQREIGDPRGQGYSLTYLGHALIALGELAAASTAYTTAMTLRRELGQYGPAIDDLAGLAAVALAQGNLALALAHTEEILAWIEAHGVEGIEYPLQVYLTCYRVLQAATDDQASAWSAPAILDRARELLQQRATGIKDERLRRKFLENVATHREIMAAQPA